MNSNLYLENLWDELVVAWDLCVLINQLPEPERSDTDTVWNKCVKDNPVVDLARTKAKSEQAISEVGIFCKNRYGAHFNEEMKMWVPFRHGPIDHGQFNA